MVPGLAKDMPQVSEDGKVYKLTLRPNMKYSDGTPIKASDFTHAIKRLFKANPADRCSTRGSSAPATSPTARPTRSAASSPMTTPVTSPSPWKSRTAPSPTYWD